MLSSVRAGVSYFALVFAAGFILGTIRVLFLLPRVGEFPAVAIELPFMLAISLAACLYSLRKFRVANAFHARLLMGAIAFALLISMELALGKVGFGRALGDQLTEWTSPAGALGLAGQAAFALFPLTLRPRG
jgi:hypothetical protein